MVIVIVNNCDRVNFDSRVRGVILDLSGLEVFFVISHKTKALRFMDGEVFRDFWRLPSIKARLLDA